MLVLGHLGIGSRMARAMVSQFARPLRPKLRLRWIFLGCLLPDLIDKVLFYGPHPVWVTGTRTIAHTLALTFLLLVGCGIWAEYAGIAIAIGMATHLALDIVVDFHGAAPVVFWPLMGGSFPVFPYADLAGHLHGSLRPELLVGEAVGAVFLISAWLKRRST